MRLRNSVTSGARCGGNGAAAGSGHHVLHAALAQGPAALGGDEGFVEPAVPDEPDQVVDQGRAQQRQPVLGALGLPDLQLQRVQVHVADVQRPEPGAIVGGRA